MFSECCLPCGISTLEALTSKIVGLLHCHPGVMHCSRPYVKGNHFIIFTAHRRNPTLQTKLMGVPKLEYKLQRTKLQCMIKTNTIVRTDMPAAAVMHSTIPTADMTPLPTAMTAAACMGIAWYLCVELSVRILIQYTRRSLYFWSCLICSWAIIVYLVLILLAGLKNWEDYGSAVLIHVTWLTFIVSQSLVLYCRYT